MRASFERGVLHLDGKPTFLLSGDYPYYRDEREHWRERLQAIREAGVRIVTTYVPWRHHAPTDPLEGGGEYDFDGHTQANRDVIGFLRLCEEMDFLVVLKPGPFVHAELRYGGLPDYVDPETRDDIEPEISGRGDAYRWEALGKTQARALPAPLDPTFNAYVGDWLANVTRRVLAPMAAPRGPLIAVQLLNEGIYSDAASGLIPLLGYSRSSTRNWHAFLADTYGSIARYNALHATTHARWEDVRAPARVDRPREPADLLTYLDRSRFTHALHAEVMRVYAAHLHAAGLDRDLPLLLNVCPNINAYRALVGSNDGWYSKVEWRPGSGTQWGYTDWMGVTQNDPRAFLQAVLCATRERGPSVEDNWGFSRQYDPAYAWTQPSWFQSLLSLAAGATGINVYTMAATTAWREDENIDSVWTGAHDYPAHAPIASDGTRHEKYWSVSQLAHHLAAEGASLVGERRADVAWAVYPPYAWAGAWAPRGEADEAPWVDAGLAAMPRVTYRGLEAFLEDALLTSLDVAQIDVQHDPDEALERYRCLVLAGYEFMDAVTQTKLARFVERGGVVLLTGFLPSRDEHFAETDVHPLRRIFDHTRETFVRLPEDELASFHLSAGGSGEAPSGLARGWVVEVEPPRDAHGVVHDHEGRCVGYAVRRGEGCAIYLGAHPWYTALHGDDPRLVSANRGLTARLLRRLTDVRGTHARVLDGDPLAADVDVWQYGAFQPGRLAGVTRAPVADVEHLAIVSRMSMPAVREIEFTRSNGAPTRFRIALAPRTVCLVTFEDGRARSLLLKCVNDRDGVAIPPYLDEPGGEWRAGAACDLCVTRTAAGELEILVANTGEGEVDVEVPLAPRRAISVEDGEGREVPHAPTSRGVRARVRELRNGGVHRVRLAPRTLPSASRAG